VEKERINHTHTHTHTHTRTHTHTQATKMAWNKTYFSMLTLNVNGLNFPIKSHRLAIWIEKPDLNALPTRNASWADRFAQVI
jgi:hypothetical protein